MKQKGFIFPIMIIIVLIAIFVGGFYFITKQNKPDRLPKIPLVKITPTAKPNVKPVKEDTIVTPDGRTTFIFPSGSFSGKTDLSDGYTPCCIVPEGPLRNAGVVAYLKIMSGPDFNPLKPFTIVMKYDGNSHLDEKTLAIYASSETHVNPTFVTKLPSKVDTEKKTVTAEYQKYGIFGLLGELKCPNDKKEPSNDNRYNLWGLSEVTAGTSLNGVLDSKSDEDWYKLSVTKGKRYIIETINLAPNVDTIIEISDTATTLQQNNRNDKNVAGSRIEWVPERNDTVYLAVKAAETSKVGCDATYDLLIKEK
ncbi:MAG: hypothetical protein M1365_03725 [Actinobacteria bacterium]|nr:hypothetical protein [Actinomycetota bacterium]